MTPQCAESKHNDLETAPCLIVVSLASKDDKNFEENIVALKLCIGGMLTFKEHLSFLRQESNNTELVLRYSSKSHTAALCLKSHLAYD